MNLPLVEWNKEQPGYLPMWEEIFGIGPFELLESIPVPEGDRILGWKGQPESAVIQFEPGWWYTIALPPTNHWSHYGVKTATFFHSKWFRPFGVPFSGIDTCVVLLCNTRFPHRTTPVLNPRSPS